MLYLYRKRFIIIIILFAVNKVSMNEQKTSVENECSSGCISGEVDGNELNEVGDVEDDDISDSEYNDYDDEK